MYATLLFDLDGTLIDPAQGVYTSLRYAMEAVGVSPIRREDIRHFLGNALDDVLAQRYGLDEQTIAQVHDTYLRHYRDTGLYQTVPAPGMVELTARLHSRGFRLAIATCKPWELCGPTLEVCGFAPCFAAVAGSYHNGVPEEKSAVIQEALRLLDCPARDALMIGDRAVDVAGARACGLPCVGLELCGYADPGELAQAGAVAVAASARELEDLLTNGTLDLTQPDLR